MTNRKILVITGGFATAMALMANAAHAQSSVTLYGVVDAAVLFDSGEATTDAAGHTRNRSNTKIVSDTLTPSAFGLKGVEDLGGGVKAIFHLESGFNIANGRQAQDGAMFNRQASVGLMDDKYGTFTVGRQFDSYSDMVGPFASSNSWAGQYGAHFGDIDNLNQAFNLSNAIKYVSPELFGITFGGTYALGGHAGDYSADRAWSVAASFTHGPISLGAGYLNVRDPFTAVLGATAGASPAATSSDGYSGALDCSVPTGVCGLQNAQSLRSWGGGGSYSFGDVTVGAVYSRSILAQSQFFATPAGASFDNYEANVAWTVAPMLTVGGAYVFTDGSASGASPRFHQVNVGANYALSKRTTLYTVATAQKATGSAIGSGGASDNTAQIPYLPGSASDKQLSVAAGIRVNF